MHIEATVDLPIPASVFWEIRNREDYLAIECKYLKNASKVCTSEDLDTDGRVVGQHLATKPDLSIVPPFLLKMLPGEDGLVFYDDLEFCFDDETTPFAFIARTTPSVFSDKANIKGYVRVIPSADGLGCTQVVSMDVKVSQWGVGGIVETLVAKGIQDAYHIMPDMVREWQKTEAQKRRESEKLKPQITHKRAKSDVSAKMINKLDNTVDRKVTAKRTKTDLRVMIPRPLSPAETRRNTSTVLDDIGLHYSTDLLHFAKPVEDAIPSPRMSPNISNTSIEGKHTHFPRDKNVKDIPSLLSNSVISSQRSVVPAMHELEESEKGYLGTYSCIFQSTAQIPMRGAASPTSEMRRVHSARTEITGPILVICRIYIMYYLFSIAQILGIGC